MKNATLIGMLALACASASADELAIKEFKIGADLRALAKRSGMTCSPSLYGATSCSGTSGPARTIAGARTKLAIMAGYDGKIGLVQFVFAQNDFDRVRDAFKAKYTGLRCTTGSVQNRFGAKFDQEVCVVAEQGRKLVLKRRDDDVNTASATLSSAEFDARADEGATRATSKAKKDI